MLIHCNVLFAHALFYSFIPLTHPESNYNAWIKILMHFFNTEVNSSTRYPWADKMGCNLR